MSGDSSRQPRDFEGLLRYAIEASSQQENEASQNFSPMDDDRRRWLENALNSMSVNIIEELQKDLKVIHDGGDTEEAVAIQEASLSHIVELVEHLDVSNDFHKIGGFSILVPGLRSPHSEIRLRTSELVVQLMQNNPYCQNAAAEQADLIPALLELVDTDMTPEIRVKALSALSCLVRDNEKAQKIFSDKDGYSVLLRAMQSDITKLKIKASFFLSAICNEHHELKDVLCSMGFVEQLVALIQSDIEPTQDHIHEHLLSALCALVKGHKGCIAECQRPELNLDKTLQQRLEFAKDKEEFKELEGLSRRLLEQMRINTRKPDGKA